MGTCEPRSYASVNKRGRSRRRRSNTSRLLDLPLLLTEAYDRDVNVLGDQWDFF